MGNKSKDILVGYKFKGPAAPEKITESFDGENEGITYSKLTNAFKNLPKDIEKKYNEFCRETNKINIKLKSFTS